MTAAAAVPAAVAPYHTLPAPPGGCAAADLIAEILARTVRPGADHATTARAVHAGLSELHASGELVIPAELTIPRADGYARRLLHHDRRLGVQAIVMTWGIGQGTLLHDHDGLWGVAFVTAGALDIEPYTLTESQGDRHHFVSQGALVAAVGDAGTLESAGEYHTVANALPDRPSVSLHIYGGAMSHCGVYLPLGGGWYRREERELRFSA